MAVLQPADYKQIRSYLYRNGQGKGELKLQPFLPSKTVLTAGFQALEDRWETQRLNFKADLDTAIGFTTSATLARFIFVAWFLNRLARGL